MRANRRKAGLCLVGLLVASFLVVTPQQTRAQRPETARGEDPDVGTVRGTLVFGSAARPDAGSDIWVFAGKTQFPPDCAIFPSTFELTIGDCATSTFELTIGDCATSNRSLAFLKHAQADGHGSFEISDLPVGVYTLVLRSAHVGGTDKRDAGNKFVISWFSIKGGETIDASTKF
jgi:hypothetical protein